MKILRYYILFLLLSIASVAFAVTLPSHAFYTANELYAENEDNIELTGGVMIGSINLQILTSNSTWGFECLKEGEQGACQDCCKLMLLDNGMSPENLKLFNTCMSDCGGGESLPLGSVLCLLPFALAYGIVKRYNNKKADC